jgi:hypothetical protein
MRRPSITTPEPVTSCGDAFPQGLKGSGPRKVENTFTTDFSKLLAVAVATLLLATCADVTELNKAHEMMLAPTKNFLNI